MSNNGFNPSGLQGRQDRPPAKPRVNRAVTTVAAGALALLAPTAVPLSLVAPARAQEADANGAARLRNLIATRLSGGIPLSGGRRLNGTAFQVEVRPLPGNRYAVRLSGAVHTASERDALVRFVRGLPLASVEDRDVHADGVRITGTEAPPTSAEVINLYRVALGRLAAPVTFEALALPSGQRTLLLSGVYSDQKQFDAANNAITGVKPVPPGWTLRNLLDYKSPPTDTSATDLKDAVTALINNADVSVDVQKLSGDRFAVHLSHAANARPLPQAEIDRVLAAARAARPEAEKDKLLVFSKLTPPAPIERVHALRFLRSGLPGAPGKNEGIAGPNIDRIGTDEAAKQMASFLSTLHPSGVTVTAQENRLVLRGEAEKVQRMRQLLALHLDVPSPLVRADVFTIQINSTSNGRERDRARSKMDQIQAGVQITRDLLQGSQQVLTLYIHSQADQIEKFLSDRSTLMANLHKVGFDPNPRRPLSVNEALIFLMFVDHDQLKRDLDPDLTKKPKPYLTGLFVDSLNDIRTVLQTRRTDEKSPLLRPEEKWSFANSPSAWAHREALVRLIDRMLAPVDVSRQASPQSNSGRFLMDRMAKLYNKATQDAHVEALEKFLSAWIACTESYQGTAGLLPTDPKAEALAGQLTARSAATDLLLKQAMDAITADLQDLYFGPLLDWIRVEVQQGNARASGVDLVGATSIVVRDRTLAENAGEAEAFAAFTPIPKITEALLKSAQTLSAGEGEKPAIETVARDRKGEVINDAAGNPVKLTSGQTLDFDANGEVIRDAVGNPVVLSVPKATKPLTALGALSPTEALLLQTVFAVDAVEPVYRSVAPGTSLSLRPFVLPGGVAARVQMNLTATVGVSPEAMAEAAKAGGPVDRIKSHTVATEATISAYDLVEISTFGAQTTQPGSYTWNIPILSSLPLLGDLFHGPRRRETHRQDSIAIVNLTILPRSLDLVPFYNPSDPPPGAPPVSHPPVAK